VFGVIIRRIIIITKKKTPNNIIIIYYYYSYHRMISIDTNNDTIGVSICGICAKNKSAYTCPKCNIKYCTTECYKDTSRHLKCSEEFYRDQVLKQLKSIKLDEDVDGINKMARILKREAKLQANEESYDSIDSDDDASDNEKEDEDEMIKAYKDKINEWKPWWHSPLIQQVNTNDSSSLSTPTNTTKRSSKIFQNGINIDVSKTNDEIIFADILQDVYLYCILTYIYQLEEESDDDNDDNDSSILKLEIAKNYVTMKSLIVNESSKFNLKMKINFTIQCLLNNETFILSEYINKPFLIHLIDDLILLSKNKVNLSRCIVSLYEMLTNLLRNIKLLPKLNSNNDNEEAPLNPFHSNSDRIEKKTAQNITQLIDKKEVKLIVKRFEYFNKWLLVAQSDSSMTNSMTTINSLNQLKQSLEHEDQQMNEEGQFIHKHLATIRTSIMKKNDKQIEILK
jgi:hypothetical protein